MAQKKVKSPAKIVIGRGPRLEKIILSTLETCANVVGSTLGPGGLNVLIERGDSLPPILTKDGVTVFKSLGFDDAASHVVLESARDAAVRTAQEAGDGTTSSTLLAYSIVREVMDFCKKHPKYSPQKAARTIQKYFASTIQDYVRGKSRQVFLSKKEDQSLLNCVARVSANGDVELANAVLRCFEIVGSTGNVTLEDHSGQSRYEVERLEGFAVGTGYSDSCGALYQGFVNDIGRQVTIFKKPYVILYFGKLFDLNPVVPVVEQIIAKTRDASPKVVIVATQFGDRALQDMFTNFQDSGTPDIYPLVAPQSFDESGQFDFLQDLGALTGGKVFDPINNPLEQAKVEELGVCLAFEAQRYRSSFMGFTNKERVQKRVAELQGMLTTDLSQLSRQLVEERLGKITQGIARLKIYGNSSGDIRERRDRAEDAIMAIRGALRAGVLPGGGKILAQLSNLASTSTDLVISTILPKALLLPVERLYENAGYTIEEFVEILKELQSTPDDVSYDLLEGKFESVYKSGLLDSAPAVLEALRNATSIATQLGTNGGLVVYPRDHQFERQDARDEADFKRAAEMEERPY